MDSPPYKPETTRKQSPPYRFTQVSCGRAASLERNVHTLYQGLSQISGPSSQYCQMVRPFDSIGLHYKLPKPHRNTPYLHTSLVSSWTVRPPGPNGPHIKQFYPFSNTIFKRFFLSQFGSSISPDAHASTICFYEALSITSSKHY